MAINDKRYAINNKQIFRKKKILITAGPTWVPIDNTRVISNIATGETGILLAERLEQLGAGVTLLLGPQEARCLTNKIKLIRFKFFDELKNKIIHELKSRRYDALIHSAAVSDYKPAKFYRYKINSDKRDWKITLLPTAKIIDLIKKINSSLLLVGFKFEPRVKKAILIKETKELMRRANLDLAVANTINKDRYVAYIVESKKIYGPMRNKKEMVKKLVNIIRENICKR